MEKLIITALTVLLTLNCSFGQDWEKYSELIKEAEQFYDDKEYLESGKKYADGFVALGNKGAVNDRYNAACSWALANQSDSSFAQLFIIARKGNYTNLSHLTSDTDLTSLHEDKRWSEVIELVRLNKEKAEAHLDKALVAILDTVYTEDQKYRKQLGDIEEEYGRDSDEMRAHVQIIIEKDSINLIKVTRILDERGWLGADVIGDQGNSALFLVIQHADLETQEKYLPMMREAVKDGRASSRSLALLEDRVALRKGEKQIYGSQIGRDKETGEYYVLPLLDPDNVDQRREEVGLGSLGDYVSNWGINWDVEEYKKKLPEYEAKQAK